jgi:uncharacterized protein with beta-barrel porin domain
LNLTVDDQSSTSMTSSVGGHISRSVSQNFGVFVLQGRARWIHEFRNDSRTIATRYVNDPRNNVLAVITGNPDRNYFSVDLGISGVFKRGTQAFFGYQTIHGLQNFDDHIFTAGVRFELQ